MTFNLNDMVIVKLTPHGYRVAKLHGLDYRHDGSCSCQMREFMQAFGPHLFNGCDQLIEGNLVEVSK